MYSKASTSQPAALIVPQQPRGNRPHKGIDHRLAPLPNHPGVIHAQALDEHRARVGVQDHGELRVQTRAGGTRSVYPTRARLDSEAHRRLEFIPVGVAHASPSEGRRPRSARLSLRRF
jgi:hypothetical protein